MCSKKTESPSLLRRTDMKKNIQTMARVAIESE
jgi:hypothetical protein